MSTYLELVNGVVYESKQTLDPLTAVNFATPPRTSLYDRIKRWVNQSYMELLNDKPEWFFTSQRAIVTLGPRLLITDVDLVSDPAPVVGDILTGQKSGVVLEIISVYLNTEIEDAVEGAEYTVGYEVTSGNAGDLVLNELMTLNPVAVGPDIPDYCRIGGRGRYNFKELIPTLDEIVEGSVVIQPAVDITAEPGPQDMNALWPVNVLSQYTPADRWSDLFALAPARPVALVRARNGEYELYPHPDKLYDMSFSYNRRGTEMVLYNDTPVLLPEKYHEYLIWAAMEKLADFNENQKLFARAKKNADKYRNYLYRDYLPSPKLYLSGFDIPTYYDDRRY